MKKYFFRNLSCLSHLAGGLFVCHDVFFFVFPYAFLSFSNLHRLHCGRMGAGGSNKPVPYFIAL